MSESKYLFFWGGIFSNWYPAEFVYKDIKFNCSEQAMMWEKAITFGDSETAQKILESDEPSEQQKLGRIVIGYDESKWAEIRLKLAVDFLVCKFGQDEHLKKKILSPVDKILVEASPYDKIWGIGLSAWHPDVEDETKWQGQNLLGIALMETRKILREGEI